MNNYALSCCLLKESKKDKKIVTGILHKISDDSTPFKVVVDRSGIIIDLYEKIANDNNVHVASWLRILTLNPTQIEFLDIKLDPNESEIINFLETASKIRNNKKLIVYSHNSLPENISYNDNNSVEYKNNFIKVLNNNEAMNELTNTNKSTIIHNENNFHSKNATTEIKDSIVAGNNSTINKPTLTKKQRINFFSKESITITILTGVIASLIAAWIWSKI